MLTLAMTALQLLTIIKSVVRASGDKERAHMHGIHFHAKGTCLRIAATNGHWLAQYENTTYRLYERTSMYDGEFLVSLSDIKKLMRALTDAKETTVGIKQLAGGEVKFVLAEAHFTFTCADETFPDFARVIPKDRAPCDAIAFASDYLGDVIASAAEWKPHGKKAKAPIVAFAFGGGELEPMMATTCAEPRWSAVVMPVVSRLSEDKAFNARTPLRAPAIIEVEAPKYEFVVPAGMLSQKYPANSGN
jgi:hypothetical protein